MLTRKRIVPAAVTARAGTTVQDRDRVRGSDSLALVS